MSRNRRVVVDLFAGAGGWDLALRATRHASRVVGIEIDRHANATRAAAGLETISADLRAFAPETFPHPVWGLVGSPPCQRFSIAGARHGSLPTSRRRLPRRTAQDGDDLVDVPLRWALARRPTWIALEQVPPVLPIWENAATTLGAVGYATWTAILDVADYGVPQLRRRAVLLASRVGTPRRPTPTERPPTIGPTVVGTRRCAGGLIIGRATGDGRQRGGWGQGGAPAAARPNAGGRRVTFAEAGTLQTFPLDYPWQGTAMAKAQQIGNAIPVRFALALVLAASNAR